MQKMDKIVICFETACFDTISENVLIYSVHSTTETFQAMNVQKIKKKMFLKRLSYVVVRFHENCNIKVAESNKLEPLLLKLIDF